MSEPQEDEAARHKLITIIVNGRPKEVTEKELTFDEIVNLAYNNEPPSGPDVVITVTYTEGKHGKHGSLVPGGEPVKAKADMVFNVTATDKS
jgi:hypothetical protein